MYFYALAAPKLGCRPSATSNAKYTTNIISWLYLIICFDYTTFKFTPDYTAATVQTTKPTVCK